ncbi:hypothetical protein K438DRAFT_1769811 [Mycena galopus ATCC 62051]|nr:hypothetical protein K438DRAFT_1769811 [Mycena galopus ATCC 62051]
MCALSLGLDDGAVRCAIRLRARDYMKEARHLDASNARSSKETGMQAGRRVFHELSQWSSMQRALRQNLHPWPLCQSQRHAHIELSSGLYRYARLHVVFVEWGGTRLESFMRTRCRIRRPHCRESPVSDRRGATRALPARCLGTRPRLAQGRFTHKRRSNVTQSSAGLRSMSADRRRLWPAFVSRLSGLTVRQKRCGGADAPTPALTLDHGGCARRRGFVPPFVFPPHHQAHTTHPSRLLGSRRSFPIPFSPRARYSHLVALHGLAPLRQYLRLGIPRHTVDVDALAVSSLPHPPSGGCRRRCGWRCDFHTHSSVGGQGGATRQCLWVRSSAIEVEFGGSCPSMFGSARWRRRGRRGSDYGPGEVVRGSDSIPLLHQSAVQAENWCRARACERRHYRHRHKMHRALQIAELVEMICSHLAPGQPSAWITSTDDSFLRGHLLSLAKTCKVFREPCLDALWKYQTTLLNLLRCMPDDLWSDPVLGCDTLDIVRPITPEDWERPLVYLPRIRFLILSTQGLPPPELFETLALCLPMHPLFPNLQSLDWDRVDASLLPCIWPLIGPRITHISIQLDGTPRDLSLLANLSQKCPSLTSAFIGSYAPDSQSLHVRQSVSWFVRGLWRVQRLCIPDLDQLSFGHLATLPSLRLLMIQNLGEFVPSLDFPHLRSKFVFPSLEEVDLSLEDVPIAVGWVEILSATRIVDLTLHVSVIMTTGDIAALCQSFSDHLPRASLQRLETQGLATSLADQFAESTPAQYYIKTQSLRLLFCFLNLETVSLEITGGLNLDDSIILEMARAWPNLKSLSLWPECPTHVERRVTLSALIFFARHCPALWHLHLDINARVIPTVEAVGADQQPHTNLTELRVQHSPILDASAVTGFLFPLFPHLTTINAGSYYADQDGVDVMEYRMRWERVEADLVVMKRAQSA